MNVCQWQVVAALIAALAGAASTPASAGKLRSGDVMPATDAELGPVNWTGFFFTPYFGYETLKLTGPGRQVLKNPQGWRLGAEAGYDQQFGNLVLGVAADGYYTWYKGGGTALNPSYQSRLTDYGTVHGRVGFAVDRFLIYGTGGYAIGNLDVKSTSAGLSDSQTLSGWTAGAGVDWAYQKNLFVRFELAHIALGNATFGSLPSGQQSVGADLDLFKITLISRF